MKKLIFLFLFLFLKMSANSEDTIISCIRNSIIMEDSIETLKWLSLLEKECPEKAIEAKIIKSFVLGALGEENEGRNLLLNNLILLEMRGYDKTQIDSIYSLFDFASEMSNSTEIIRCGGYQPKGLSIKYWFGAAALAVGVVTAPFGNPASPWLIGTGVAILIDTVPDLLENKEKHDKGLPPYDEETQKKINEILQNKK
jgi:hypothetical protein